MRQISFTTPHHLLLVSWHWITGVSTETYRLQNCHVILAPGACQHSLDYLPLKKQPRPMTQRCKTAHKAHGGLSGMVVTYKSYLFLMFHVFGLSLDGQIIAVVIMMSWILSITITAFREFLISLYLCSNLQRPGQECYHRLYIDASSKRKLVRRHVSRVQLIQQFLENAAVTLRIIKRQGFWEDWIRIMISKNTGTNSKREKLALNGGLSQVLFK